MSNNSNPTADKRKSKFEEEGFEDDESLSKEPMKKKQDIGTPSEEIVDSTLEPIANQSATENAGEIEIQDSSENVAVDEVVCASNKDQDLINIRKTINQCFDMLMKEVKDILEEKPDDWESLLQYISEKNNELLKRAVALL